MKLETKVCLITGGTRGIGAATALRLARAGVDIAICARHRDEAAAEVVQAITALGRRVHFAIADISQPDQALRVVKETQKTLAGLDILIHCAGGPAGGNLLEISLEDWYAAFDTHVHAVFHLCRAAVPTMRGKREGAIVLVGSAAGVRGCANAVGYGVVKGALPQFARGMARDFAVDNIRVNCVAPGVIRTRFQSSLTAEQVQYNIQNRIPLQREGSPEQVAEVIAMLVENDFITGETVIIDGGMSMRMA